MMLVVEAPQVSLKYPHLCDEGRSKFGKCLMLTHLQLDSTSNAHFAHIHSPFVDIL